MEKTKNVMKLFCCTENSYINRLSIAKILRLAINILWISLALVSLWISGNEVLHLINMLITKEYNVNEILHEIVTIFIYIEIIAMIIKYFEENYHFPLRYIIYIAITALARHIIGDFEHAYNYTIAILLLAITYAIIRIVSHIVKNKDTLPPYD